MSLRQLLLCGTAAAGAAALSFVLWRRAADRDRLPRDRLLISIVEFNASTDSAALHECMVALQDEERRFVPRMPSGKDVVAAALSELLERGSHVRLAVTADRVVLGYVAFGDDAASLVDGGEPLVRVSDLFVVEAARGRGVGRALLAAVEQYALDSNVGGIRVEALAQNVAARRMYERVGFAARTVEFEKRV